MSPQPSNGDYSKTELQTTYEWLKTYCLQFLNFYLKEDPEGQAFLNRSPAKNGAPKHFFKAQFQPSLDLPPNRDSLAHLAAKTQFQNLEADYFAMKARAPEFELSEEELKDWALRLWVLERETASKQVSALAAKLYPNDLI